MKIRYWHTDPFCACLSALSNSSRKLMIHLMRRLTHVVKHLIRHMLRCHTQLSAYMIFYTVPLKRFYPDLPAHNQNGLPDRTNTFFTSGNVPQLPEKKHIILMICLQILAGRQGKDTACSGTPPLSAAFCRTDDGNLQ